MEITRVFSGFYRNFSNKLVGSSKVRGIRPENFFGTHLVYSRNSSKTLKKPLICVNLVSLLSTSSIFILTIIGVFNTFYTIAPRVVYRFVTLPFATCPRRLVVAGPRIALSHVVGQFLPGT
jgi:hypothetical protein